MAKLIEIEQMVQNLAASINDIPNECKGMSDAANINRRRYLEIRRTISNLQDVLKRLPRAETNT